MAKKPVRQQPDSKTEQKVPFSGKIRSVQNSAGQFYDKHFLNPTGRAQKYSQELKMKKQLTNDGKVKKTSDGGERGLSVTDKAYRQGYLAARQDSADIYNLKNNPLKLSAEQEKRKKRFMDWVEKNPKKAEKRRQRKDFWLKQLEKTGK